MAKSSGQSRGWGGGTDSEMRTTPLIDTTGAGGRTPLEADSALIEARAEIRRQDDFYAHERVKWGVRLFLLLWIGSVIVDAIICLGLGLGSFEAALWRHLLPLPPGLWLMWRLDRGPTMSDADIFRALTWANAGVTIWLSLTVVATGGMVSPYQTILLFATLTMIIVPTPLMRGIGMFVVMILSYFATMLVGVYVDPALRRQLFQQDAWLTFMFYVVPFWGMGASMVAISHLLWSLRREVFESKSIGKYSLKRLLGRGGMGEVWAAYHSGLKREVALKLLNAREGASGVGARRFEREVQALVRLSHPNTVRVFDFGAADGGLLYYAMELLEGENLGRLMRREGPLPEARARHFLLQASRALAEAHQRGIVHRDVKPENLFVTVAGGEPDFLKVLDFGIATLLDDGDGQKLTQTGTLAGTPGTVSPEVIRGEPVTPGADVYALGAVGYLMLAGSLPFEGEGVAQVMLAHLHDAPVAPSVRRGSPISPAFEAVILRCLSKNPTERYRDGQALSVALASIDDMPAWVPERAALVNRALPQETAEPPASADDDARTEETRAMPSMRPDRPAWNTPGKSS